MTNVSFIRPEVDYSVLNRSCVIIDPSSVVKYHGFKNFMQSYYPVLTKENRCFLISKSAIGELTKSVVENISNESYRNAVAEAIKNINFLVDNGQFKYYGSLGESNADSLLKYVMANRKSQTITVITQDGSLAHDVLSLNNLRSSPAPTISVRLITTEGYLKNFSFDKSEVENSAAKAEPADSLHQNDGSDAVNAFIRSLNG